MFIDHPDLRIISWLCIVAVVFVVAFFNYMARARRYRLIERMVEKGLTVPPELLGHAISPEVLARYSDGRDWRYGHPISSGIFLMCIGVAIAVFFWAMQGGENPVLNDHGNAWLPFVGIFPFMLGLARLLGGAFERRSADHDPKA